MFTNKWAERQRQVFAERRADLELASAASYYASEYDGFDRHVVLVVLKHLKGYLHVKDLQFALSDDLGWLLGIDDDEKCDLMEEITDELGCTPAGFGHPVRDMKTVKDLIIEVQQKLGRS